MHNELTQKDIRLMREELDYRRIQLRPKLLEAVKEARGFGDLSENFEYKAAKQEKNRNESRIRFLENMIRTAVVISDRADADTVGLYDRVTVYLEDEGDEETYQVVTTMRQDALHGLISKESPLGKALLGRRVGERFHIQVNDRYGYDAVVRAIQKGQDDGSVPLSSFCPSVPCQKQKGMPLFNPSGIPFCVPASGAGHSSSIWRALFAIFALSGLHIPSSK